VGKKGSQQKLQFIGNGRTFH